APNGDRWILSNLASQQNLFRTLDGLSKITGDPKYKQAAMEAIEYAFENLRSPNGLLYWGLGTAYDAGTERIVWSYEQQTSMKGCYPYYELMWEADSKITKQFIEAFWSVHILDWTNLDMDRIGYVNEPLEKAWDYEYRGGPVFFRSKRGYPSASTASDLYYAAVFLYDKSGQKEPLIWGKRLAHRYVETRNPKTGISGFEYSVSPGLNPTPVDSFGNWIVEFSGYLGHPKMREGLLGLLTCSPGSATEFWANLSICQLMLGEMLGASGKEFRQWAHEELTARGRSSYRMEDNSWVPMLSDGTSLEGVDGHVGWPRVAWPADAFDFWSYALAFRITGDEFMWQMARNVGRGNGFGDIGANHKDEPLLLLNIDHSCPYAALGFLELYRATQKEQFLEMGNRIGDNILANKLHGGFFLPTEKHIYAQFNAIEALVLLHLHSAGKPERSKLPKVWPGKAYFMGPYRGKESGTDQQGIYSLTNAGELPVSIGEAARMGDIKLIKSLIAQGEKIDRREERFFRTALHYAATRGHRSIVELLLAEGADVNIRDWSGLTPLHYATIQGHNQIIELLIAGGADVNAKNIYGETSLQYAARHGRRDIVELLLEKGAIIYDIYTAVYIGDTVKLEAFIQEGADINALNRFSYTPLYYAAQNKERQAVSLLIANGADVNAKNDQGQTPLHQAAEKGFPEIAKLLIANGADINAKNNDGQTPLDIAVSRNRKEIVELLIAKGADVSLHTAARHGL
ncbi:MAG: ankyrin repeat domain-containing protein, partial [Deltaproteobacteria bacterium]|nr:ankyrin repeat domain-containing protein [Deltaproteobacteria bacterium]